jgi:hypothetical protein
MERNELTLTARQGNPLELLRQQTALAKFGELALTSDNLDHILTEACSLVSEGVGTDLAKVMALQDDGETLLVRAGVGWKPGIVGKLTLKATENTSEGVALRTGEPMISPDVATENRFEYPDFLTDNGVHAVANVVIIGGLGKPPFGILQVDSRKPRPFTDTDVTFLRSYANRRAPPKRGTASPRPRSRWAGKLGNGHRPRHRQPQHTFGADFRPPRACTLGFRHLPAARDPGRPPPSDRRIPRRHENRRRMARGMPHPPRR